MTFMTVTYELQDRLNSAQFRTLGEFSNTYGLHKFRYDEKTNRLISTMTRRDCAKPSSNTFCANRESQCSAASKIPDSLA